MVLKLSLLILLLKNVVYMKGCENQHKVYENQNCEQRAGKACEDNNLWGKIWNSSKYITKTVVVCNFMDIKIIVPVYEVDQMVVKHTL